MKYIDKLFRINSGALKQELFLLVCVSQTIICISLIAMDQVMKDTLFGVWRRQGYHSCLMIFNNIYYADVSKNLSIGIIITIFDNYNYSS